MASPDSSESDTSSITTLTNVNLDVDSNLPQRSFSQAKYYKQTYRIDWELMPDFQGWLSCVPGEPTRAYCKFCDKTLHAHRLSLLKHTCTLKHTRAAKIAFNKKQQLAHVVGQKRGETLKLDAGAQVSEEAPVTLPVSSITLKEEMVTHSSQDKALVGGAYAVAGQERATETPAADKLPSGNVPAPAEGINAPVTTSAAPPTVQQHPCNKEEDTHIPAQKCSNSPPDEAGQMSGTSGPHFCTEMCSSLLRAALSKCAADRVIITEVHHQSESNVEPLKEGYISTHVLDTSKGRPVAGLMVSLYRLVDGRWTFLAESLTNPDGRCTGFVKSNTFVAGRYKLHYDVDRYYEHRRIDSLYPFIEIVFDVRSPKEHYHIPLLLSPYGYTTYKGS